MAVESNLYPAVGEFIAYIGNVNFHINTNRPYWLQCYAFICTPTPTLLLLTKHHNYSRIFIDRRYGVQRQLVPSDHNISPAL